MSDFWDNILKFPRFFISSTLGLILTILGPLFNLLKTPQTTAILIGIICIAITSILTILKAMLDL